jgi:heterodisulfide reductase subunit C
MSEPDRIWDSENQKWVYPVREEIKAAAIEAMKQLLDDERVEVMAQFCMHCGNDDPECVCMKND